LDPYDGEKKINDATNVWFRNFRRLDFLL
jgi:hypothetical protein